MFVEHHGDMVHGIAVRSTRNRADAEDLAQDAFIRAYRALAEYDPQRIRQLRPRGWLAQITLNAARNRARSKTPASAQLLDGFDLQDEAEVGPERSVELRDSAAFWKRLLNGLPPAYRMAVGLRHVDGLSYAELADALGKPVGTVKSDVHRGVRMLRAAYEVETGSRVVPPSTGPLRVEVSAR